MISNKILLSKRGPWPVRFGFIPNSRTARHRVPVYGAGRRKIAVSEPLPSPPPPHPALKWAIGAGLALTAAAALHLMWRLASRVRRNNISPISLAETSMDKLTIASLAPLLLAAETGIDDAEYEFLTDKELEMTECNLRLLVQQMDMQLNDMKDKLYGRISDDSIEPEAEAEEDEWQVFSKLSPVADDSERRTYRSLMVNRSLQMAALTHITKQMNLRAQNSLTESTSAQVQLQNMSKTVVGLDIAGASIPHPKKALNEDAYFVNCTKKAFGVADGVGGWSTMGIDPSEYPRLLMSACLEESTASQDPLGILHAAFARTHVPGSCTAVVVTIDSNSILHTATIGDCGVKVVRQGEGVVFQTDIQEHEFNQPLQLASPQHLPSSTPDDAVLNTFQLQVGDVVILGSDGLWDNIWNEEVCTLVADGIDDVAVMATALVHQASLHAADETYRSPFAVERFTRRSGVLARILSSPPTGGKLDDVTAVVAKI